MAKPTRGETLKAPREQRRLTQAALAKKVGVTRNTTTRLEIEDRAPSLALLDRLAKTLGAQPGDLL